MKAGRYYISVIVEISNHNNSTTRNNITVRNNITIRNVKEILSYSKGEGIGIDLGLKEFVVLSNKKVYKNINKSIKIKKLEK